MKKYVFILPATSIENGNDLRADRQCLPCSGMIVSDLTYIVTESHVDWNVHTCGLFVPRQLAPVSKICGAPLDQAGHHHQARQHLSGTNTL